MPGKINLFWFRRDLRMQDNTGLYHALSAGLPVLPLFIFDRNILDGIENREDKRVSFIYSSLQAIHSELEALDSGLKIYYGFPPDIFNLLTDEFNIQAVFTNHDYEPYAKKRDAEISRLLEKKGTRFYSFKDQVIFEKDEIVKADGKPYTVFTPYSHQWKSRLNESSFWNWPVEKVKNGFYKCRSGPFFSLSETGFTQVSIDFPPGELNEKRILNYGSNRDFPGVEGTTRLGIHLRFGTISIRQLAKIAQKLSGSFLNELVWRDFYQMILWQFPQVGEGKCFKPAYENIPWRNNEAEFELWRRGETGYPIVDAGMRELLATGYMHNRVRMIVASFLSKHLLIDWRWGEAWFAEKLLDFDLASNNGGWQWAAGCGCDAAPYFRIFNPTAQAEKFDPDQIYIRRWVPEYGSAAYPAPMVEHVFARNRALEVYGKALKNV